MGSKLDRVKSTRNAKAIRRPLGLTPPETHTPSAFFLGPNAENIDIMQKLIGIALEEHAQARADYPKIGDDPNMVAERDPSYETTTQAMYDNLRVIMNDLRNSIPLSSNRNQSHMYWDITMPGAAGYFAGMLFNQNNVAAEASPVTTALEIRAANELCTMLGYNTAADPKPWGHITCDGTVANLESMWAARNLKYQAAALARAILEDPTMELGKGLMVPKPEGGTALLVDLSIWEMLNLRTDDALALPQRLVKECGLKDTQVKDALEAYCVQDVGLAHFNETVLHGAVKNAPAVILPATGHYSWPKAATILGLGRHILRYVEVDFDGRMKIDKLREQLEICLKEKRPVLQVVSVMGTTGESAVDPLVEVLKLKEQFANRGLTFCVHADAAWGGYFASMIRKHAGNAIIGDKEETALDRKPEEAMSDYVRAQFETLGDVDSITVDPHKAGFIPYPAGALCFRNSEMIYLNAQTSPVVFHDPDAPTVGVYGVESSKPGAAAVGVALSHISIPPDQIGYGRLLSRCVFNSKRFYADVTTMAMPEDDFFIVPFQRLPIERKAEADKKPPPTDAEINVQRDDIRERIAKKSNDELMIAFDKDAGLLDLFQSLGPDLTVFSYVFNFKLKIKGKRVVNDDVMLMNEFNELMYTKLSHEIPEDKDRGDVPSEPMFVTSSSYDPATYGTAFLTELSRRTKVKYVEGQAIRHLISTLQNPFLTSTAKDNFIPTLTEVLRDTANEVRKELINKYRLEKKG